MKHMVLGMMGALALATAARAAGTQAGDSTAGRTSGADSPLAQELQPALRAFEDAWNRHDPQALAGVFAEDGVVINPSGRVARGRAQIRQLFEDEHQRGPLGGTQLAQRVTSVREVAPGLAFVDQDLTISGGKAPSGEALPDQRVHAALLLARRGGTWQALEARPYVLVPAGGPRVSARAGPAPGRAALRPDRTPVGPGAGVLDVEDTSHFGP